ncbi:MAG TPA: DsrE family protein [Blastocatellia bacterium]|nr:DsrE family protein [Blastocatellia bacterium]
MTERTLNLALMDAPYESAASTTAFRIIASALGKGIHVNVFAYEGAVSLTIKDQAPHANPVKGTSIEEEDHPTTKNFVAALLEMGKDNPLLAWVNCGLCVDERGAGNWIEGVKRGGPGDFLKMAEASTSTLVIPTR